MPKKTTAVAKDQARAKRGPLAYELVSEPDGLRFAEATGRKKGYYLLALERLASEGGSLRFDQVANGGGSGNNMDYLVSQLRKALGKLNEADPDGIQYTLKTAQAGGLLYVKLDVAEEPSVSTRRGRQQKGLAA